MRGLLSWIAKLLGASADTAMAALRWLLVLSWPACVLAQVNVLTYHNDNARTGQNPNETILTLANVNSNSFGKLFSCPVDGQIYGQPLYVANQSITNLGIHNVVFVVTEHDSIYAFDADNNTGANALPLWQVSFLNPAAGVTTVPADDLPCDNVSPEIGITSTPVIDTNTGTIYIEAKTREVAGGVTNYVHRLHALDLSSGAEKFGGPVVIQATVSGTGDGSDGTNVAFDGLHQMNRPGLLLLNGAIYIAYASHCDIGPYHGWIFVYDAQTLQLRTAFNTTPNDGAGGIWQSGAGLSADTAGNIYCLTGNGGFDSSGGDYGDSFLKLSLAGTNLNVLDYFTPFNQDILNQVDLDLGSGGAVILPDEVGSPAHQHLLVGAGKEGKIYLLDRDNLGQFNGDADQALQVLPWQYIYEWAFGVPAYFNKTLYYAGAFDVLKTFAFAGGLLLTNPVVKSNTGFGFTGATPSISANGTNNAIVWALQAFGGANSSTVLRAYNATNIASELYDSLQAGLRDDAGPTVKFAVPTVANGKVYVGTATGLAVFGNGVFAPPAITPNGGSFSNSVTVTLTSSVPGAAIHYTTDGTTPTATSPVYAGRLTLTDTTTLQAVATMPGWQVSPVAVAVFQAMLPTAGFGDYSSYWVSSSQANLTNDVLTLSSGLADGASGAFFKYPQPITNFTMHFVYQSAGPYGIAVVAQNSPSAASAVSEGGGCLGYCEISPCAAVEFNTGTGVGDASTGLFAGGAESGSLPTWPVDLGSGYPIEVTLRYHGGILRERLVDQWTADAFETSYSVDLPSAVGGSNTAWIGFTAATTPSSWQTISNFTFTINYPPVVSLLSPSDGALLAVDRKLILEAGASEAAGSITNVSFFNGSAKIGEATTPPYQMAWTKVTPGVYILTAVATDSEGTTSTSDPVQFTVTGPALNISRTASGIEVAWRSGFGNYALEFTTDLTSPAAWASAPGMPVTVGNQSVLTLPLEQGTRYYRLRGL